MSAEVQFFLGKGLPVADLLEGVDRCLDGAAGTGGFLLVAETAGNEVVLGRYQNPSSALRLDRCPGEGPFRRHSGGKAVALGTGSLYLAFILPSLRQWIGEPFSPDRTVNRYIRPILGTLEGLGVRAFYYGTDYLILNGKRGGYVSFDIGRDGVVLMETVIALTRSWAPDPAVRGYPPRTLERSLPDTTLEAERRPVPSVESIVEGLAGQLQKRYGVSLSDPSPFPPSAMGGTGPVGENRFSGWSRLRECAIGFLQAGVDLSEGRIRRVGLFGDFIANSPAIEALQSEVIGCPPEVKTIEAKVEGMLRSPNNFIIGVRPLTLLTEVILEAAGFDGKGGGG